MDREIVIQELQRVANLLSARSVSRSVFSQHGTISSEAVEATFGTWNEAIAAAGLIPLPPGGLPKADQRRIERLAKLPNPSQARQISDEELLDDLIRLAKELRRRPSGNQIAAKGKYSRDLYQRRWGSVSSAYGAAVAREQASKEPA